MQFLNEKRLGALAVLLGLVLLPALSQAIEYNSSASATSVLRFQKTMASKGHPQAQYKLAMMYETGSGAQKDLEAARHWYNKAAYQNFKPARNRLAYLDIQQTGFQAAHEFWLKDLQHDAKYGDGESLFLLGQMYAHGVGVEKNLKKSVLILRKAAASNIPGSEAELTLVEKEYASIKQKNTIEKNKQQREQQAREAQLAKIEAEKQRQAKKARLEKQQALRKQKAIAAQQKALEKIYQKNNAQKSEQVTSSNTTKPKSEKEMVTENIPVDVCAGRNRFSATCR